MKRRFLRILAGLTIPAFCLLVSPRAWAAGRSAPQEGAARSVGVSLSIPSNAPQSDPADRLAPSRYLLERSERLWGSRVNRGIVKDTLFLYTVEVDGETVMERVGSGCIEENYYVRASDLSDISVSGRCKRAPDWADLEEAELEKPVSEGGNLRMRGYLREENDNLYTCREITVTDQNGTIVYYDLDVEQATKNEHYSFRVTTTSGKHSTDGTDSAPTSDGSQTLEREWTYVSSDGRELWRVALQGRFQDGVCLEAVGTAETLSDNWKTEDAEFCAEGSDAVARVTVSRLVLGFVVAKQTYEFHLEAPS